MWRSYKKHNAAQLQILAELNACSAEEMRDRLMLAGIRACDLPRAERKKKGETEMSEERMPEAEQEREAEPAADCGKHDLVTLINTALLSLVEEEVRYSGDPSAAMETICAYYNMRDRLLEGME